MGKKFLVLDLDETLLHTFRTEEKNWILSRDPSKVSQLVASEKLQKIVFEYTSTNKEDSSYFVPRPGMVNFLNNVSKIFTGVIVWSAGKDLYVDKIVNKIFYGLKKPVIVLDHSYLTFTDNGDFLKDLNKVYSKVSGANETNTIILDDKKSNFRNNPRNGINIPKFEPTMEEMFSGIRDDHLINISSYFMSPEFSRSKDVRNLDFNMASKFCHIVTDEGEILENNLIDHVEESKLISLPEPKNNSQFVGVISCKNLWKEEVPLRKKRSPQKKKIERSLNILGEEVTREGFIEKESFNLVREEILVM